MHLPDSIIIRYLVSVLHVTVCVYFIVCATLYFFQDRMLLHPGRPAPKLISRATGDDRIATWSPAGEFNGYAMEPTSGGVKATVIVFHGNAGTAEERQALGAQLVRLGYRAVLVEYPGFGRRPGRLTLANALDACRAATRAVLAQWSGPVILLGESLGAGMAAQTLSDSNDRVTGIVLITPWDTLAAVAARQLRIFPVRWLLHDSFDSMAALQHFQGSVVVIGAGQDRLIPVAHARRLALSKIGSHYVELPETEHNDWLLKMTTAQWSAVSYWLDTDH